MMYGRICMRSESRYQCMNTYDDGHPHQMDIWTFRSRRFPVSGYATLHHTKFEFHAQVFDSAAGSYDMSHDIVLALATLTDNCVSVLNQANLPKRTGTIPIRKRLLGS